MTSLRYYDKSEIRIAMGVLLGLDLISLSLISNDMILIHDLGMRIAMVASRGAQFLASVVLAVVVLRRPYTRWYLPLLSFETALLFVLYAFATISRPPTHLLSTIPTLIIIAYTYFLLPGPLALRWTAALLLTANEMGLTLLYRDIDLAGQITLITGYVMLNLVGLFSSSLSHQVRRRLFEARLRLEDQLTLKSNLADGTAEPVILISADPASGIGHVRDYNWAFAELCLPLGWKEEQLAELRADELLREASGGPSLLLGPSGTLAVDLRRFEASPSSPYDVLVVRKWLPDLETVLKDAALSPREFEVAQGLLEGRSQLGIASSLGIAETTVKTHVMNLYRKLGVGTRLELFRLVHAQ